MDNFRGFFEFMRSHSGKILDQLLQHIGLTFISLLMAVLIGVPAGILITRKRKLAGGVLGFAGVLQTIPSIALLGFMIPLLGIGALPAIIALFLYALLPIVRNTYTGIIQVNEAVLDAAAGMGMTTGQILVKVQLPLSMPVILAGIRTATVINVGVATLASYIGAGGLGEFIFGGIALNNSDMILAGAIPAACLALMLDFILSAIQKWRFRKIKTAFWLLPLCLVVLSSFYLLPAVYRSTLLAGFTPEFMGRDDGYMGLKKVYHLSIRNVVISDAVMYTAVHEGKLDLIDGYSTDGRVKAFHLTVLRDDKHIFPPYYAAPVVRQDVLAKYPRLERVLNLLAGHINDSVMTDLNYRVDFLKQSPEKVAKDFLVAQHLYNEPLPDTGDVIRVGSKIFGEQYLLAAMYSMLIRGNTHLRVETKTGLGGTKICFNALMNGRIDLYPEYTGTGLLVILQPPGPVIAQLNGDKQAIYYYVKNQFLVKYHLEWLRPIGFNNTYALMMRGEEAQRLHLHTISDLKNYLRKK